MSAADQETPETDEREQKLQRAKAVIDLVVTVAYVLWLLDQTQHGALTKGLGWKWKQWTEQRAKQRRDRAQYHYVLWQAQRILEETANDNRS